MTDELRERIAEQFYGGYCEPEDRERVGWQGALSNADQILALISDQEEQFAKGIEHYRKVILPVMVEEAKREERERIIEEIEKEFMLKPDCWTRDFYGEGTVIIVSKCWRALKGEELPSGRATVH